MDKQLIYNQVNNSRGILSPPFQLDLAPNVGPMRDAPQDAAHNSAFMNRHQFSDEDLFKKDYIKLLYPEIATDKSDLSIAEIYDALIGKRVMFPKQKPNTKPTPQIYLQKFKLELKKNPAVTKQLYEAMKRKHSIQDHKFKNRMTECLNKINLVHPFNARAKWNKIDPQVGESILANMETLIDQGRVGLAYQRLQQLYEIEPANKVQEIDRRGFTMRSIPT